MDIDVVVGNKRRGVPAGYVAVEVGRPSVLGNPFRVGAAFAQGEAAAAYLPYLREQCRAGGPVREAILALARRAAAGERLACMCWCEPLPCHAEHVAAAVRGYARAALEGGGGEGSPVTGVVRAAGVSPSYAGAAPVTGRA